MIIGDTAGRGITVAISTTGLDAELGISAPGAVAIVDSVGSTMMWTASLGVGASTIGSTTAVGAGVAEEIDGSSTKMPPGLGVAARETVASTTVATGVSMGVWIEDSTEDPAGVWTGVWTGVSIGD